MKADFFIDRPVFSTVLSIIIVIVGAIGLALLPVDQYPQIVPPVVRVSASYPGADAQTVTQAVATPIEQELNGTPGMIYMESSSSNSGGFSATVTFDISVDPDLAAVDVQNRQKKAEARLPAEVVPTISYSAEKLSTTGAVDSSGVGVGVSSFGVEAQAVRPMAMAQAARIASSFFIS